MPKANHVSTTSSVDRRSILAAVGGVAAAASALSTAAFATPSRQLRAEPSPLVLEHRRLRACIRSVEAQINADLDAGITPAMAKLEERLDVLCDQLTEVDEQIWATPASWEGLHARLEVAEWEVIGQQTLHMGYLADRATEELISSLRALITGGA